MQARPGATVIAALATLGGTIPHWHPAGMWLCNQERVWLGLDNTQGCGSAGTRAEAIYEGLTEACSDLRLMQGSLASQSTAALLHCKKSLLPMCR